MNLDRKWTWLAAGCALVGYLTVHMWQVWPTPEQRAAFAAADAQEQAHRARIAELYDKELSDLRNGRQTLTHSECHEIHPRKVGFADECARRALATPSLSPFTSCRARDAEPISAPARGAARASAHIERVAEALLDRKRLASDEVRAVMFPEFVKDVA